MVMLRFALFGAGRIGAMHARIIAANPNAELISVYDVHAPSAATVASAVGAKTAPSVEAALTDPAIDAVLIASSTDTHVDLIIAAAKAGKAVLCEKPIHLDIKEVDRCRTEIASARVPIQIGFNRRFDPSHRSLAEAVRRGEVGNLEMVVITSRDPGLAPLSYLKVSGGIYRDMTIHDFDLARFILGDDPVEVYAAGSIKVDPELADLGDVDTAMIVMKTASGVLVHINNSRRAVYGYDQRVEAFGSAGMVQSDNWRATTLKRYTSGSTDSQDRLLDFFIERYSKAYTAQMNAFVTAVTKQEAPSPSFEDGRRALILADAAWEATRSGRSVEVRYD
jgi:myo-inositol 2-dehydrogenase/D-chiro-inositol 1-dehydrogenase